MALRSTVPLTSQELKEIWSGLNRQYFDEALPPIDLVWSRRLTASAGMFVSRVGPRSFWAGTASQKSAQREIRLSLPLLKPLVAHHPYGRNELISTLAHEMIHQWQYDLLKRRPNHGPDFLRKMTEMNRDGELAVTIYHSLQTEVLALAKFAWRCRQCGRIYRRQRRTIQPRRHHCGNCRGSLQELGSPNAVRRAAIAAEQKLNGPPASSTSYVQLELDFFATRF
ncbi:SprT-like domain-containing protein [Petrachloros mirabilis]